MRIVNPAAIAFVVLSIFVAAARSDEQGISTAPAQSAVAPAEQPRPVTLAELKLILESALDGEWEAGAYLKGLVDLGPNARSAMNTIYLIFPWAADDAKGGVPEGIVRAKKITENWSRPTKVVWTSDRWVVIGDGMSALKDEEVAATMKRLTGLLKGLAPKAVAADTATQASCKSRPSDAEDEREISVELGFRKKPPVFAVNESIVVEARFVNRTDKPQVYRGGLGDKNIKASCQIKLMAEGGKAWSAWAAAAAAFANYKDIEVPAHGQTLIGEWDLSKLVYSEGSGWRAGGKIPFAEIARLGKYRVRWWDGVFQAGTPLRSEPVDFEIVQAAMPSAVPTPPATQLEIHGYMDRIRPLLPKGWSVRVFTDDALCVEHEQSPTRIMLRIGTRIGGLAEYRRLMAEREEFFKNWHARFPHGSSMMPDAPAVLLRPPTHFDDRHSVWLQRAQTGPGAETGKIETKELAAESNEIYASVAKLFTPYDSTPPDAQPASNPATGPGSRPAPERVKELIEALAGGHGDAAAHKAVRELRLLGKVALPYLTEAVKDNRRNVRWLAVETLGGIGGLETAPALIGAMGDPDKDVRRYAATFLGQVGGGDAPSLAALRKGLKDEDTEVVLHVLWSLERLGDKVFLQDAALLERLLAQVAQGRTTWAVQCLGILRNEKAVEPLVQALRVKPMAAQEIGLALAEIRSRKAVPGLVAILKENGIDSRSIWQAAITLQKLGDPSANEELLAMTGSSSPWTSLAAVEALGFAGNKDAITRLSQLATDRKLDKLRREGAVRALGRTEEPSAVAALGAAVVDPEERVANEAAKALGWVKSREAAAVLRSRLNAKSCGNVMYAVTSLGRIGDLSDARAILEVFDRKDALDSTHFANPRMANVATACHSALADITKTRVTDKDKLLFVITTPQQLQEIHEAWRQKLAQLNAARRPDAPRATSVPATGASAVPLSRLGEVDLGDFWQGEKPIFRKGSGIVSLLKKQAGYLDAADMAVNNPAKSGRHAGAALFKSKQEAVAAVEFWRKNVANIIEPGTQTDQRRFPWWFCAKSSQPLLIVVHDGMVVWAGDITWGTPYNKVEGDLWRAVERIHSSLLAEPIQAEIQPATEPAPPPSVVAGDGDGLKLQTVLGADAPSEFLPGQAIPLGMQLMNASRTRAYPVVKPGDGSESGWREPHVYYSAERLAADGRWTRLDPVPIGRCGLYDGNWQKDVVTLKPGDSLPLKDWLLPPSSAFEFQQAGRYRIRAHYAYRGGQAGKGAASRPADDLGGMKGVKPFEIVSAPIEIVVKRPLNVTLKVRRNLIADQPARLSDLLEIVVANDSDKPINAAQPTLSAEGRLALQMRAELGWPPTLDKQDNPHAARLDLQPGQSVSLLGKGEFANGLDGSWTYPRAGTVKLRAGYTPSTWKDIGTVWSDWVEVKVEPASATPATQPATLPAANP